MKIEWLVTDATAVKSSDREERAILGVILAGQFLVNLGHICGRGATLQYRNPHLSPSNFTQGHLMKIEWLVIDVTAVRCSDRAEPAVWAVVSARLFFGQFRSFLMLGSHFVV